jgi:hypothetical protein
MSKEILDAGEFAMIKEYFEVGGSISGIATVTGLSQSVVREVKEAPHYKQFMEDKKKVHRTVIKTDKDIDDLRQILITLSENINKMITSWENIEHKLDEVLETRKPWLGK